MTANSVPQDLPERVRQLERRLAEQEKRDPGNDHHLRDHIDGEMWSASDGHASLYDSDTGLWKNVIPPPMITFNMPGALALLESDVFWVPADCKIFLWSVGLKTTGSSTSTIDLVKHPSTVIDSLSLGSGDSYENAAIGYALSAGDGLFVETTALGTGAEGAVVSVWAKAQ